jgi:hypothetical protein
LWCNTPSHHITMFISGSLTLHQQLSTSP